MALSVLRRLDYHSSCPSVIVQDDAVELWS